MKRRLRLAAAQMRFAPTIAGNLQRIGRAVAAARGADAVLFPECALTGYRYDFRSLRPDVLREALGEVADLAATHGRWILLGSPVIVGRRIYNCLVVFDRRGRVAHVYAKCQLTPFDRKVFTPGNAVSLFEIDGVPATCVVCHERRYPELVRLAAMAGAKVLFHPNAGLDPLAVSKTKRGGRDGIDARAFENAIYYVFANSVGPQGDGLWSAGDSKIVAPDRSVLALAGHRMPGVIAADADLAKATGKYAAESLEHPRFLAPHWRRMIAGARKRNRAAQREFLRRGSLPR